MLTIYGIGSCDGCRKARKWLDAQSHPYTWVDVRKTPPAPERVARWVEVLGSKRLRNTSGGSYRALSADKKDWSEDRWAEAIAADPMLLKRPLLERDGEPLTAGFRDWDQLL